MTQVNKFLKPDIHLNQIKPLQKQSQIDNPTAYLKNFIKFISVFSNAQDVVCFIFADQNSKPTIFLNTYPGMNQDYQQLYGLYYNQVMIDDKKTLMIGLNSSFINIENVTQKQIVITHKHLILLYLLKKFYSVKFVICFDKDAIQNTNFRTGKETFLRLAAILNLQKYPKFGQSFMLFIYHSHNEANQINQLYTVCQNKFKKSLSPDQKLFNQNLKFVQQIINDVFKSNNRQQKRLFLFGSKIKQEDMQKERNKFQKMLTLVKPLKLQSQFQIAYKFLKILEDKSKQWTTTYFSIKASKDTIDKTNVSQKQQNNKKDSLRNIFCIWDRYFQTFLKFILKKSKTGKNTLQMFKSEHHFAIQKPANKYQLQINNKINLQKNQKYCQSYLSANLFAKLLEFLVNDKNQYERLTPSISRQQKQHKYEIKQKFLQQQLQKFIRIFYECEILDNRSDQKVIYDNFMIFNELVGLWSQIIYSDKDNLQFFEKSDLTFLPIYNIAKKVKVILYQNVMNLLTSQLQIDLNRLQNGQYVRLQLIQQPIKRIRVKLLQQSSKQVSCDRLNKTLDRYEIQLCKIKIKDLGNKPLLRLQYMFGLLKGDINVVNNRDHIIQLGLSVIQFIDEYKIDVSIDIKRLIIKLLQLDGFSRVKQIMKIYQSTIQNILVTKSISNQLQIRQSSIRQSSQSLNIINSHISNNNSHISNNNNNKENTRLQQQQSQFILQYSMFLIKLGYIQKVRQMGYEISNIDSNLSKRMICKTLMKSCIKYQQQFIKYNNNFKQPTSPQQIQKIQTLSKQIQYTIQSLSNFIFNDKFTYDYRKQQEQSIIDI